MVGGEGRGSCGGGRVVEMEGRGDHGEGGQKGKGGGVMYSKHHNIFITLELDT